MVCVANDRKIVWFVLLMIGIVWFVLLMIGIVWFVLLMMRNSVVCVANDDRNSVVCVANDGNSVVCVANDVVWCGLCC